MYEEDDGKTNLSSTNKPYTLNYFEGTTVQP